MSKFIQLPVFANEQKNEVMTFVNFNQIRYIIPKPYNKCKIVFNEHTYCIVNEGYEEITDKLKELGYYSDL